jgi:hypothetical protein
LTTSEGNEEAILQIFPLCFLTFDCDVKHLTFAALEGGPCVGVHSNSHTNVASEN